MSFRDDVVQVLSGGLPSLIEVPTATAQADPQPERIAPEPQLKDNEPFNLANVGSQQILLITAGVIGLIGLVAVLRR